MRDKRNKHMLRPQTKNPQPEAKGLVVCAPALVPTTQPPKMKIIRNNASKMDRLLSNGHQLLSHLGHLEEKLGRVLFNHVHLSTHFVAMCADVLGSLNLYKQSH
jgi:hypothetical protein